jgi:hypothetical protein
MDENGGVSLDISLPRHDFDRLLAEERLAPEELG